MRGTDFTDVFVQLTAEAGAEGRLWLPQWRGEQWRKLLSSTLPRPFRASEVVIQRDARDRALFLVAEGVLEVGVTTFDGVSVTPLARITAGTVVGEQSFFDEQPRSANVWAVSDGMLLQWDLEQYGRFGEAEPALARDFLFAVARVLSTRLRLTTIRVRR